MRKEQYNQANNIVKTVKQLRAALSNLEHNLSLSEFEKQHREYELAQAINYVKADAVDLLERILSNDESSKEV